MSEDPTQSVEISTRLTVHEFILEVLLAELLAALTDEHGVAFRDRLLARYNLPPRLSAENLSSQGEQLEAAMLARGREQLIHLIGKVADREAEIRRNRSSE